MTEILLWNAAVVATLMTVTWLTSLALHNASIVDIIWGLGFVAIAWTTWMITPADNRSMLLPILTTVWGTRLSGHLAWRNHGQPEDFRYRSMRERHGKRFWWVSAITVFLLQGIVMWIVSLPIQASECGSYQNQALALFGCAVWLVGFFFESVGDLQLARFRADPENSNSVMDQGLWRFTRHPNYFGDFCVWWGIFLIAYGCSAAIWSVASPVVMSILLMKFSGVALLEKTLVSRREGYAEYVRRTSAFFPMPVRNQNSSKNQ